MRVHVGSVAFNAGTNFSEKGGSMNSRQRQFVAVAILAVLAIGGSLFRGGVGRSPTKDPAAGALGQAASSRPANPAEFGGPTGLAPRGTLLRPAVGVSGGDGTPAVLPPELSSSGLPASAGPGRASWQVVPLHPDSVYPGAVAEQPVGSATGRDREGAGTITGSRENAVADDTTLPEVRRASVDGAAIGGGRRQVLPGLPFAAKSAAAGAVAAAIPVAGQGAVSPVPAGVVVLAAANSVAAEAVVTNADSVAFAAADADAGQGGAVLRSDAAWAADALTRGLQIMPLGDSITEGYGPDYAAVAGYREALYTLLSAVVPGMQFVGTCRDLPGGLPAAQQGHEGHGCNTIENIARNLDGLDATFANDNGGFWLTGGHGTGRDPVYPGLILLLIGTNDILQNDDLAGAQSRLDALVAKIVALRPDARLLLATLAPIPDWRDRLVADYNRKVTAVAAKYAERGAHVRLVDLHTDFPIPGLAWDSIHPDATGYQWMAGQWYRAILGAISAAATASEF